MQNGKVGARGLWSDLVERAQGYDESVDDPVAKCVKNYMKSLDSETKQDANSEVAKSEKKVSSEEYDKPKKSTNNIDTAS